MPLKFVAYPNMLFIFVTEDTSQSETSPLKFVAYPNMLFIFVTEDTSQSETSPLNFVVSLNMLVIVVTEETSQLEMSALTSFNSKILKILFIFVTSDVSKHLIAPLSEDFSNKMALILPLYTFKTTLSGQGDLVIWGVGSCEVSGAALGLELGIVLGSALGTVLGTELG